jgi:hypothetical protein
MSLFEEASLVITPNAFKAGKLYAVKGADLTVTRATSATRVNANGVIESVGANVPRIDYTGGGCPSILVEPQRTNLTTYSEDLSNVKWLIANGTITSNVINSPSGVLNADLYTENALVGDHAIFEVVTYFVSGTTYTTSFFVKANGRTKVELVSANSGTCPNGRFDLLAQTATAINGSINAKIENVGNGWYKCSVSKVAPNTGLDLPYYVVVENFGILSRLGDGTSGMYFWGMQTEAGSYATSYIPTTSAAVTRNADVISKTGISSLIGQTEGTIFLDFIPKSNYPLAEQNLLTLYDSVNADNNNIQFIVNSSKQIIIFVLSSGSVVANINTGISALNSHKISIGYKVNDLIVYIDGVQVGVDTSFTIPALNSFVLNNYAYANFMSASAFNSVQLYKTRLTNAELAELTTL